MILVILILMLILLLTVLLFTVASKLIFSFDTTTSSIHLTMLWLYPFLRSEIEQEDGGFIMRVFLFNKRILTRKMGAANRHKTGKRNIMGAFSPTDIHINTRYGFRDPYATGLATGVIGVVSQLFAVESLHEEPDFLASDDYINLDGTAKLNLGRSLLKII